MGVVIGLTGGTGCGKSMAATYLQQKGAYVIDADQIARHIVEPGQPALTEIAAVFPDVLLPDGTLNRKKLGSLVFADRKALATLNHITHRYIIAEIEKLIDEGKQSFIVIDAPLLLECGLDRLCTLCIAICSNKENRLHRIMERDNLTKTDALNRINAQPADHFYRTHCQHIIENNGEAEAVMVALDAILKELPL
ncbi:MAG: dephospho-CoA kinase [Ruminococcaceae bacterium]|nr:dephospho-CoA kinase [Oscillospiraceae bacterium]